MFLRKQSIIIGILLYSLSVFATQSTPYILTEFPIAAMGETDKIWIKWTGASRDPSNPAFLPDSGRIYFSTSPGGGVIDNYTDSITVFEADTNEDGENTSIEVYNNKSFWSATMPVRGSAFKAYKQENMGPGVYYYIVAWRTKMIDPVTNEMKDTVFFSNELKMIIETSVATTPIAPGPGEVINSLTPVFKWEKNPGVPYYHILLSDEKISPNFDEQTIEGLSLVWQAITADVQITYGAPDPSGTITATPPPLSPGKEYSWIVLNNYGNHPAYTSKSVGLPQNFSIAGEGIKAPVNIYPPDRSELSAVSDSIITFKWTNIDPKANTFKIYAYVASDFEGVEAQLVVWEDEVTAGDFKNDTGFISVDASKIFTTNKYTWKIIAVDENGAGSAGEITQFKYSGIPTGTLNVHTREYIEAGDTTIVQSVAGVKIELEVLDGSMEAPLLYYTDLSGDFSRTRPTGQYRLTVSKDGFEPTTKTIILAEDETSNITFYMKRPDATIFGRIFDEGNRPVNLANIKGISDRGDTVETESDALGNFVLNCYESDWNIWVQKDGYISPVARDTTVTFGQSIDFGFVVLVKNPLTLSGTVKNPSGNTILGAKVELLLDGVPLAEVPSTAQNGEFSFALESGTYSIKVTKTGFASKIMDIDLLSSKQIDVILSPGAALIRGVVYGKSWSDTSRVYAPITNCKILLIDSTVTPAETLTTVSDAVYGDFEISVPGGKVYSMYSHADGFIAHSMDSLITLTSGKTVVVKDTLLGLATLDGTVKLSGNDSLIGDIAVVLIDTSTGKVSASVKSDALGTFEIRDIKDGVYRIQSGKSDNLVGYVQDTVLFTDRSGISIPDSLIEVVDGRAVRSNTSGTNRILKSLDIFVKVGDKSITWAVLHQGNQVTDATIKVRSPIIKNINSKDTLRGVGGGIYVITIDAAEDTLLDIANHVTNISGSDSNTITETISLNISHPWQDTISVNSNGNVTFVLHVFDTSLSSVTLYYKDLTAKTFSSTNIFEEIPVTTGVKGYLFTVKPPKNGSNMTYYFDAKIGDDTYGYEKEQFVTFVKADPGVLTRVEVTPSKGDTLVLPADSKVEFTFNGYYGSKFVKDSLSDELISWKLLNSNKCGLNTSSKTSVDNSTTVTVYTPKGGQNSVSELVATIDTTGSKKLASGLSNKVSIFFIVSSGTLDSILVKRVDGVGAITTALVDKAEFVAEGIDSDGTILTVSPTWTISPENAGTISADGIFDPSPNFAGYVRVIASVLGKSGEYNKKTEKDANKTGLEVHYILPRTADSLTNGQGLSIKFPDSVALGSAESEISVEIPYMKNKISSNTGEFSVIGNAYDINEENGVVFDTTKNIMLTMDIPEDFITEAISNSGSFAAGLWNEDSLTWDTLHGSVISDDGTNITVAVKHFSRYGVLYKKRDFNGELSIFPNPFSPYIKPVPEVMNDKNIAGIYGSNIPFGACIKFTPKSKSISVAAEISIHTITGELIMSAQRQVDPNKTYYIWWDGKTNEDRRVDLIKLFPGNSFSFATNGKQMCRNGRYFVVLRLTDQNGEKKQFMKPIILFK